MSLAQLESQIDDLRAQADRIQRSWARTSEALANDVNLSATGKRDKRDAEHAKISDKLRELRKKETDLIAAKRQSLERRIFGLSSVSSTNPNHIIAYRDAQDRAAKLPDWTAASAMLTAAKRSDDTVLAAAVLGRALDEHWSSVVSEYLSEHPEAKADFDDLAALQQYDGFMACLSYLTT